MPEIESSTKDLLEQICDRLPEKILDRMVSIDNILLACLSNRILRAIELEITVKFMGEADEGDNI